MNNIHNLKPGDVVEYPGRSRHYKPTAVVIRRTSEKSVWFSYYFNGKFDEYQFRKTWHVINRNIERHDKVRRGSVAILRGMSEAEYVARISRSA